MKTGLKTFNNARPVNTVRSVNTARSFSTARSFITIRPYYTAHPKSTVSCARPKTHFQNQAQSTVQRPCTALTKRSNNQNINTGRQTVNTVRPNVNTVRARGFNASNSQLNDKGFVDSGCSRHMSGNIAHLSDFKDFNGGYVTFGGGANGGRTLYKRLHQELTSPEQTATGKDFSNPLIVDSLLKTIWSSMHHVFTMKHWLVQSKRLLFWRSAEASTDANGEVKINATIDGHSLSITEGSLRRHLKLVDQDGITSIPTTKIFEQLALMGYHTDSDKLTFQKATNRKFNFSRMIFEHMVSNISSSHKFLMYPRFIQLCLDMQRHQLQQHTRIYPVPSLSMKVFSNMKRSTKGFLGQEVALFPNMLDVTEPSTSPSRITSSPSSTPSLSPEPTPAHTPSPTQPSPTQPSPTQPSPTQPSPTQPSPTQPSPTQPSPTQPGTEHHLPTPHDSPLHAVHSHGSDEGSLKLQELMNLVTTLSDRIRVLEADLMKTKKTYSSAYTKLILRVKKLESQIKIRKARRQARVVLSDDEAFEDDSSKQGRKLSDEEVQEKAKGSEKASDEVSIAGAKKGTASEEVPIVSTAEVEPNNKSKKELEQERLSYAEAIRLEEQMNEEQRDQVARDEEIVRQWDAEERQRAMDEAKSTKKIDWNDPSVIRYHTQKMKSKTVAQARRNMIKYLKNQGNYKISNFKGMSYNDIRPIFEKVWDFNQNIEPMDAEHGSGKQKSPEKSPEKMEEDDVVKEPGTKRKKSIPRKSTRKRQKLEEDTEKDELKGFLDIVPREEVPIEVESIST
ncbi:hypothetical protein Tco_1305676, partial [Tanacetum coccineum]